MVNRIILADDHQIVRQGIKALLQNQPGFEVVAEADTGRAAVRLCAQLSPDVAIMDLRMPDLDGIEATRQIIAEKPYTKVIGLSGSNDEALATAMIQAGASGYVLKDCAVDELIAAIKAALLGHSYVSPHVNGAQADRAGGADGRPRCPGLSPREQEVLQLVAGGRSTKQAARDLSVSVKTIETHRRNLMEKLQIDNVADLTKYAIRHGLCAL